jgi:hypothetical protein
VILDFGITHVEITHRKFDECADSRPRH